MILENPMNAVLQVLPSFHTGGVEQTTLLIANALAAKGVRSFIVSSGGILTRKLHPGVIHIEMPLSSKNPFIILKNTKKLRRINLNLVIQYLSKAVQ